MRYLLEVAYDGTAFHGSQVQGELNTVQFAINKALSILLRQPVETFGASRTDEGVHALGNAYHFDWDEAIHPQLVYKLNALLPPQMAVKRLLKAHNPEFNARFDASSRRYRYKIYQRKDPFKQSRALFFPYPIDLEKLRATAEVIKEYIDFESFCKRNSQTFTHNCTIFQSYWEDHGDEVHYIVEANRFLRGMVRALVGTQLKMMKQEDPVTALRNIITAKNCTLADFSVTGNGLYLEAVNFPPGMLEEVPQQRR
ncbi:MAG: tRNA pseudouridine(38-40) synthase TruA [Bacteroidetes bacterium 43-16]|nr:MAG: tRNA pseudouridine(38-40) synthase TruA [Bacteroidetes bacterium 43-16]